MKPRSKNEREVARLSASLKIRKSDLNWIAKCHKCGQSEYFAIYEAHGDWQVIRMFMYRAYSKHNEFFHEPLRYWIKSDGKSVIECKNRQCLGNYYIDAWCRWSELAIRKCGCNRDVRLLNADYTRIHSLIPQLKRMGFRADNKLVKGLMPFYLVQMLLTNNRVETFFKLNQTWLTWKFYHYDELTEDLWQAIRVALRHGYHWDSKNEINDWCDMIHDLQALGLDIHSPHYICPVNLHDAHQHWMELRNRQRKREQEEAERNEVEAYEPTFRKNREMFFDMVLKDKRIVVKVIPTAMGIKEEGKAMHHCVGNYYNRPNSLIMSATINGKRVETIEVSLKDYRLVQSRGLQNKSTKYHERIVALVEQNLGLIQSLHQSKRKQRKQLKSA